MSHSCATASLVVGLVGAGLFSSGQVADAATLWPQPASLTASNTSFVPLSTSFKFEATGVAASSQLLQRAFVRYEALLQPSGRDASSQRFASSDPVAALNVVVDTEGDVIAFGVNESYSLTWDLSNDSVAVPTLHAATVFGALRGLETFSQLVENDNVAREVPLQLPVTASIVDAPRFQYRGLMMDYARHFYPVQFIEHTIDAMAASKLNVLHMHITDDQSFPMVSASVPALAQEGAFRDRHGKPLVYTAEDMQGLAAYAQDRGVLLVPEFDMPAHASSWGAGVPDIVVTGTGCSSIPFAHGDVLNPTINATYDTIDKFLGDMVQVFPPPFLHLGGDEVPVACWEGSPDVTKWMSEHSISPGDYNSVERYFVDRVASLPSVVNSKRTVMYWEEVFNNNASISPAAIIQAWKSDAMPAALKAGHSVTNSYKWYLNHGCNNYGDGLWADFYENDPVTWANESGVTPAMLGKVLGGETTMWAECVDAIIFDAIVWPRAAAAAEQLWSPRELTRSAKAPGTAQRMAEHRCRLVARGVGAAPVDDSGSSDELAPRRMNPGCQ